VETPARFLVPKKTQDRRRGVAGSVNCWEGKTAGGSGTNSQLEESAMLMLRSLLFLLVLGAPVSDELPAVDVSSDTIQRTLQHAATLTRPVVDIPIRTVDAGGHRIGIGVVYRPKGAKGGAASHDKVSEIYDVLAGSGTLVTGGTIVNPKRRAADQEEVTHISGPGVSGKSIEGGESRVIKKGDIVVIPAGTPHWFSDVSETLSYMVVRVDPSQVVALK